MLPDGFDPQPSLVGADIALRPLRAADFEGLYAAAARPEVWAGHPARNRHERPVFERYFAFLEGSGTTLVVTERAGGRLIGCSRYYGAPDRPGSVSIGFTFLADDHWGGATNFELKRLMLGHAFESVSAIWFHIDPTNIRSQKATAKLGAVHDHDARLDLSGTPADWMCFRLDRDVWIDKLTARREASADR